MKKFFPLLLSACCLATVVLFAAPIRSSLGGDGEDYVEENAALPTDYITDGLVAYFDALENEDWGIYNPAPSFWKDLTGNGFDLPLDGTAVSFDNGVCTVPAGTTVNSGKALDAVRSIEVVWRIRKTTPYAVEKVLHTGSKSRGVLIRYTWIGLKYNNSRNGVCPLGKGEYDFPFGTYSFSYTDSIRLVDIYLDALRKETSYVSTGSLGDLSGFGLTTKNLHLYISCIRIYDRVLTEEEVEWNYNIDKERFGL